MSKCTFSFILKTDSNSHCSVSSEDIERSFRTNPYGSVSFTTAKFNYTLDFSGMYIHRVNLNNRDVRYTSSFGLCSVCNFCQLL